MLFGWSGRVKAPGLETLRAPEPVAGLPWPRVLTWFMRAMSLLWLAKGVIGWAYILGVTQDISSFAAASLTHQTAVVVFAVVDLIAGVGLWMAAGWGGGIWLIAMLGHAALGLAMPRAITLGGGTLLVYGVFLVMFLGLAWAASHHSDS
jgi:hypothetical protein